MQESETSTTSAPGRVALDLRQLPWVRPLAADYAYDYARLQDFYSGYPADPTAWASVIARAQGHPRDRDGFAAVLEKQQRVREAPPEALAATSRLRDPRSVAVVTGQQAGLFGGPLYTLLKALTTLQLAEQVSRDHGVPTVAVFWIDSEDHDWQEIAAATVLDAELATRTVTLPAPEGAGHLPIARHRLDASVTEAVAQVRAALPPTEFTDEVVGALAAAYTPGRGVAEAFGRWLEAWLGPLGLVVYCASDPDAKPFVRRLFEQELQHPGRTSALAAQAGRALAERGYHAQVGPHLDATALFHLGDGRQAIRIVDGGFAIGDRTVPSADLVREASEHPEHFSPNVLLRPLVQDTLFPTIAYVSGPSELAYLGQLRGVYDAFGTPMPIMVPRATATLFDSAATRFLARYELPLPSLQAQDESVLNRLLEAQLPPAVEAALGEAEQAVADRMAALIAALPQIDPTLEGAARSTLGKMEHDLRTLHGKIIHAAKRRDETLRRQFRRTRAQAFPDGHQQERTLGFVYFLNRYGPALVDVLASSLPVDLGHHWVLTL